MGTRAWTLLVCIGAFGCEPGPGSEPAKTAGCQQDYECRTDGGPRYCVQAECVECRGDEDCKLPKMCGQQRTCFVP